MAKKGRPPKPIEVPPFPCPSCGKTISGLKLAKVTDVRAVPGTSHYEIVGAVEAGEGGLFDNEGDAE